MRAKVASRSGKHALDKELLELDIMQLSLLYKQTLSEEKEETKQKMDLIKTISNAWGENFSEIVKSLQIFINPKMYKHVLELKELEVHREEINEDNFSEIWEGLMKQVPQLYEVIEDTPDVTASLPALDEETNDIIAGWISNSRNNMTMKEGG